jgi:hypothetical protein
MKIKMKNHQRKRRKKKKNFFPNKFFLMRVKNYYLTISRYMSLDSLLPGKLKDFNK